MLSGVTHTFPGFCTATDIWDTRALWCHVQDWPELVLITTHDFPFPNLRCEEYQAPQTGFILQVGLQTLSDSHHLNIMGTAVHFSDVPTFKMDSFTTLEADRSQEGLTTATELLATKATTFEMKITKDKVGVWIFKTGTPLKQIPLFLHLKQYKLYLTTLCVFLYCYWQIPRFFKIWWMIISNTFQTTWRYHHMNSIGYSKAFSFLIFTHCQK